MEFETILLENVIKLGLDELDEDLRSGLHSFQVGVRSKSSAAFEYAIEVQKIRNQKKIIEAINHAN